MPSGLDYPGGAWITLQYGIANPAANATTDGALAQGGTGYVVPSGYQFHPVFIAATSNADLTAGTATFQAIDDGTELANGPSCQLSDTVQRASGTGRVGAENIAAGSVVGVSVTTTATYAPVTADHDVVLVGVLLPA